MLLANLSQPGTYVHWLHQPPLRSAIEWLKAMPADQPSGIVELAGKDMYVNVHGYDTLAREQCRFESHRHYVDLQYCITGGELIDYCILERLPGNSGYDPVKDFIYHQAPAEYSTLRMSPGDFAVFFPEDGHRPKVTDGRHATVHKLVVKIALNLFRSTQ